jgi:hypothetical protein
MSDQNTKLLLPKYLVVFHINFWIDPPWSSFSNIEGIILMYTNLVEGPLSGLSHKFLDITIVSLKFASSIVLGEGPVDRFAVAIALVRPHQHGPI